MRLILLLLALAPLAGYADAPAGQLFQAGGFVDIDRAGREFPARSGLPISVGDRLQVQKKGNAALRMADEELISLAERSRFEVLDYRFDPSGRSPSHAHYRLEAGSVRMISGLIAQRQPESVVLETPVATVRTVGTDYAAGVCGAGCDSPGVFVAVNSGSAVVANGAGSQAAGAGQIVFVPAGGGAPSLVAALPANLAMAPDPAALMVAANIPGGSSLRIELTGSVSDCQASPSQPDCTANR